MVHIIITLEMLAVISLSFFEGIVTGRYYEKQPLKKVAEGLSYAYCALTLVLILSGISLLPVSFSWLAPTILGGHLLLNLLMITLLLSAWKKFSRLPLQFDKQYLKARSALNFSVAFEALALFSLFIYYFI